MKPATLAEVFHVKKENSILGTVYLTLLALLLAACLFTVVPGDRGYNPGLYKNVYVCFMVFDLLLFSLITAFWDAIPEAGEKAGEKYRPLGTLCGIALLALSPVPLILTIFMAGRINPVNFMLPLVLKAVWGLALVFADNFLEALRPGWPWRGFSRGLFIFFVLGPGSLLAYFFCGYRQAVLTTLFDRDIPLVFFINPLLSLAGLAHYQTGGGSQAGLLPFYFCLLFWGLAAAGLCAARLKAPGGGASRG